MSNKKKRSTRDEIIYTAAKLFLERGFSDASAKALCEEMGISTGNLTYYFPTKEHLFRELVQELCRFQWKMFKKVTAEGKTPLMAACLELAAMAAICEENPVARDLYLSTYMHPLTLEVIRQEDKQRAQEVFADFCTEWSDADFAEAELLVSGIEYATLMQTPNAPPLEQRIRGAMNGIMLIYGVPAELRKAKLDKVLCMDYRSLGRSIFREFTEYLLHETGLPDPAHVQS